MEFEESTLRRVAHSSYVNPCTYSDGPALKRKTESTYLMYIDATRRSLLAMTPLHTVAWTYPNKEESDPKAAAGYLFQSKDSTQVIQVKQCRDALTNTIKEPHVKIPIQIAKIKPYCSQGHRNFSISRSEF